MEDYRLTRTGDLGRDRTRWIDLTLYRTEKGRYVVERVYHTQWQGESDHHEAVVAESQDAVVGELQSWDPREALAGIDARRSALALP